MSGTRLLKVDAAALDGAESQSALEAAAKVLRRGGLVAFPTETVYGLGANALEAAAVRAIFAAKRRPNWDPLIVHVADRAMLARVAEEATAVEEALIATFWPGPLTLLLPRKEAVPDVVTAGRATVGVRMPAHPIARALIEKAGVPIAAPSANTFGHTSPTTAQHVLDDLDGRIDVILDGGHTALGLESTVLDARACPPVLYRQGMISLERLRLVVHDAVVFTPNPEVSPVAPEALPSPGVGIRHYAPRANLVIVNAAGLARAVLEGEGRGLTGVLLPDGWSVPQGAHVRIFCWGDWNDSEQLAQRLFAGLRALDAQGVREILCPMPEAGGVGAALRDRLQKAAKPA